MRWTFLLIAPLAILAVVFGFPHQVLAAPGRATAESQPLLVYIGTYAKADEDGIHVYQLDVQAAKLVRVGAVQGIKNPSFQILDPDGKYLYSVSEAQDYQGKRSGSVSALAINEQTGMLQLLNVQPSHGAAPCHLCIDHHGHNVVVANYSSGSLAVLPVLDDGKLDIPFNLIQHEGSSIHPSRQKSPHAHCVKNDAQDRFVISADLGTDKVMIYRFNTEHHSLSPNPQMPFVQVRPGSGPRHFAFHPDGKYGYLINELSSTVTAFQWDGEQGTLRTIQTLSTLPGGFEEENTTAEVFVSPDGRFLYGSNRGHNSIVVYSIDKSSGRLTPVSHHSTKGEQPRNFGIDPSGSLLLAANQRTGTVVVFRIDPQDGTLSDTGEMIRITKPVCITFLQR